MTTQQKIEQKEKELEELKSLLKKEQAKPKDFLLEILGNEPTRKIDPKKYPNSVFYFKGDTCLLELEKRGDKNYVWCDYDKIWNPVSGKFNLNYEQTQQFIKETLEEHFKLRDIIPSCFYQAYFAVLEEHFNNPKQ